MKFMNNAEFSYSGFTPTKKTPYSYVPAGVSSNEIKEIKNQIEEFKEQAEQLKQEIKYLAEQNKNLQYALEGAVALSTESQQDVKRYQYLRNQHWNNSNLAVVYDPKNSVKLGSFCPSSTLLDDIIDADIKQQENQE